MYWTERILSDAETRNNGTESLFEGMRAIIGGTTYTFSEGILRQERLCREEQEQTKEAFGFKWKKRDTYESPSVKRAHREWLLKRYFGGESSEIASLLHGRENFLDAGCGSGFSSLLLFGDHLASVRYLGVDISNAVDVAQQRFAEKGLPAEFLQADLTDLPFRGPVFDVIFSEGVLHHTNSTENAVSYLAGLLRRGGMFLFYVYNKKGPVREFVDDHVRDHIRSMSDQEAWDALMPLTRLGAALGRLQVEVDVPEALPFLGIPKGRIDIQRLFYWYVMKAYYRPDWTDEEMNHVNFDWYRPSNCWRQTPEDVTRWCAEAGLRIRKMDVEDAGITVVAEKV